MIYGKRLPRHLILIDFPSVRFFLLFIYHFVRVVDAQAGPSLDHTFFQKKQKRSCICDGLALVLGLYQMNFEIPFYESFFFFCVACGTIIYAKKGM